MSRNKKSNSKFMSEEMTDFFNDTKFVNNIPKNKKQGKRTANTEKKFSDLSGIKPTAVRKKFCEGTDACGESRQKTLNVMNRQLESRKQIDENLFENLSEIITNFEDDYDVFKRNEQKLEHLAGSFIKCINQATEAHKESLKAFKDVHSTFKQEAEGLLLRGAIKPDDRPLWFDVYKAFPPTTEPKYARPKPENAPIRQILYKEDVIRANFHAKGHGLSVNMLSLTGESHIRKLVQTYQQLQSEGINEEELIQKSAEAAGSARQVETSKTTQNNPDSVSAKIFADTDFKNIFKE